MLFSNDANISISEVTRRKIFDHLTLNQISWSGRRNELDFLASLYDLRKMPTTDYRPGKYPTAYEDIHQHRVMNSDWDDYWVFTDARFNLQRCPDEDFLKFLCEMLHPKSWIESKSRFSWQNPDTKIEQKDKEVFALQKVLNNYLSVDGWEIYVENFMSEEPLFSFHLSSAKNVSLEKIKFLQEEINSSYIARQIDRLSKNVDKDPEAAIGGAKEFLETLCKHIISERGGNIPEGADFGALNSTARDLLHLLPENVDYKDRGDQIMKRILGSIGSILSGITELRNLYGTGHGKESQSVGVTSVQAHLIVGLAATLGKFIFDVHTGKKVE